MTISDYLPERRDVALVRWPGTEKQVGLLSLTCAEVQDAYFAAREHFDKKGQAVDEAAGFQFDKEHSYQLCFRMLLDPEAKNPTWRIFSSVDELRARLSPDLASYFVAEHWRRQNEQVNGWQLNAIADPHLRIVAEMLELGEEATPEDVIRKVAELKEAQGR